MYLSHRGRVHTFHISHALFLRLHNYIWYAVVFQLYRAVDYTLYNSHILWRFESVPSSFHTDNPRDNTLSYFVFPLLVDILLSIISFFFVSIFYILFFYNSFTIHTIRRLPIVGTRDFCNILVILVSTS